MDRYSSAPGAPSLSPSIDINSSPVTSNNKKAFPKSPMIRLIRTSVRPTPPSSPSLSAISNTSPFLNKSINAVEQLKQLPHNKVVKKRKREHSSTGINTRSKIKRRLMNSIEEATNEATSTSDSLTSTSSTPIIITNSSTSPATNVLTSVSPSTNSALPSVISTSVSPNIPTSVSSSVSAHPTPKLFGGKQCCIRLPLLKKSITKPHPSVPRLCVEKLKNIPSFVDKASTGSQSPMSLSTLLSRTPPSTPPAKPSRLSLPITRSSKVKSILSQRHSSSSVLCPSSSLMQQQNSSSSPQTRSSYSPALLSLPASPSGSLSSSSSIPHSQLPSHQNSPTLSHCCPVSISITKDQVASRRHILKRLSLSGSASDPSHNIGRGSSRQFGNTNKVSGGGPVNKDTGSTGTSGRGGRGKRNSDSFNGDSQSSDERRPKKRRGVVSDEVRPPNIVDWSCALCNLGNNASELSYLYGPLNNVNNRTEGIV